MWSILGHVVKPKFYAYGRVGEEHKSGTQRYVKEGNLGNGINSKIVHDFFFGEENSSNCKYRNMIVVLSWAGCLASPLMGIKMVFFFPNKGT